MSSRFISTWRVFPVVVADTAGLRALDAGEVDQVEIEGIRRARARAESADLRIVVFDIEDLGNTDGRSMIDGRSIVAVNKIDLVHSVVPEQLGGSEALPVSTLTGEGLPALLARVGAAVTDMLAGGDALALTRTRHRQALEDCVAALRRAGEARLPELVAEDARLAVRALGRITGRVDVEEILDVIFRDFCIGK